MPATYFILSAVTYPPVPHLVVYLASILYFLLDCIEGEGQGNWWEHDVILYYTLGRSVLINLVGKTPSTLKGKPTADASKGIIQGRS
ncbi:hypothetical protein BDV29DRAFT_168517, partial [Aspergillus leporis]